MGQNPITSAVGTDSSEAKNELTSLGLEGCREKAGEVTTTPSQTHSSILIPRD